MSKLTKAQAGVLAEGAKHRYGVVCPYIPAGYSGVNIRKTVRKLEELGFIEPNGHGDHYITPAGRAALANGDEE